MRMLGFIPARQGSKGVPAKNIKPLGNKPLIGYTIETALKIEKLDRVVVSTDSELIGNIAKSLGAEVPFLRPSHLASDESPTIDSIIHCLNFFQTQKESFDAVCLLQPTVPFRQLTEIKKAISVFEEKDFDSLVSVIKVPAHYNPHWQYKLDDNESLRLFIGEERVVSRRQLLPLTYIRSGSLYITKTKVILEQKSIYGKNPGAIIDNNNFLVNIDTLEDWTKAEIILKRLKKI